MDDKIEFNEDIDTYIAVFEHQASPKLPSTVTDLLDGVFNSAKFTKIDHDEGIPKSL